MHDTVNPDQLRGSKPIPLAVGTVAQTVTTHETVEVQGETVTRTVNVQKQTDWYERTPNLALHWCCPSLIFFSLPTSVAVQLAIGVQPAAKSLVLCQPTIRIPGQTAVLRASAARFTALPTRRARPVLRFASATVRGCGSQCPCNMVVAAVAKRASDMLTAVKLACRVTRGPLRCPGRRNARSVPRDTTCMTAPNDLQRTPRPATSAREVQHAQSAAPLRTLC